MLLSKQNDYDIEREHYVVQARTDFDDDCPSKFTRYR